MLNGREININSCIEIVKNKIILDSFKWCQLNNYGLHQETTKNFKIMPELGWDYFK